MSTTIETCIVKGIHQETVREVRELMPDSVDLYELADLFRLFGDSTRIAILFHHSGFDPPDRRHLLTPEDAQKGNMPLVFGLSFLISAYLAYEMKWINHDDPLPEALHGTGAIDHRRFGIFFRDGLQGGEQNDNDQRRADPDIGGDHRDHRPGVGAQPDDGALNDVRA